MNPDAKSLSTRSCFGFGPGAPATFNLVNELLCCFSKVEVCRGRQKQPHKIMDVSDVFCIIILVRHCQLKSVASQVAAILLLISASMQRK